MNFGVVLPKSFWWECFLHNSIRHTDTSIQNGEVVINFYGTALGAGTIHYEIIRLVKNLLNCCFIAVVDNLHRI